MLISELWRTWGVTDPVLWWGQKQVPSLRVAEQTLSECLLGCNDALVEGAVCASLSNTFLCLDCKLPGGKYSISAQWLAADAAVAADGM